MSSINTKRNLIEKTFSLMIKCKDVSNDDCKKVTDIWSKYDQIYKDYMRDNRRYEISMKAVDEEIRNVLNDIAIKYNVEIKI